MDGLVVQLQVLGDFTHPPAHPVQELGLAAIITGRDFNGSIHGPDAAAARANLSSGAACRPAPYKSVSLPGTARLPTMPSTPNRP
ncbi:hypothetical protein D9M69_693500 [compost metagenome]